jgi:hypothetical protein
MSSSVISTQSLVILAEALRKFREQKAAKLLSEQRVAVAFGAPVAGVSLEDFCTFRRVAATASEQ